MQQAKGELLAVRQRDRPVAEYVRAFRRLSGKVRGWLERLLVHQFRAGLDCALQQVCLTYGLPPRMTAWVQAATEIDV